MKSQVKRRKKPLWQEYAEALGFALILALFLRTFIFQLFYIPSESMLPTLLVGDRLLADKFTYGLKIPFTHTYFYQGREPRRGEVVIFEYPNDTSVDFIKRVIGLPGDVIEVRNKQLYRNGEAVREEYTRFAEPDRIEPVRDNFGPVTVPPGHYFVMGDNRDSSLDSRFWGFVQRSAIRAKAWRIVFSFPEWGKGIRWERMGQLIR